MDSKEMQEIMLNQLVSAYGADAQFRTGQEEAILSILKGDRALVVQKTGWGKSLIYFLSTRILRDLGKGLTIVISPLLALMNNQIEAAEKFGLEAATFNSGNVDEWEEVKEDVLNKKIDILYISPERLVNESFTQEVLSRITTSIGLLVVDEAHCISDWGHDFRPDYRRVINVIRFLPSNVPLLATTATANDRVVGDVAKQLGDNIHIQRGGLVRESIAIQVIKLDTKEERLSWLSENLPSIEGIGIIYCLTKYDCNMVSGWLRINGIDAYAYYSGLEKDINLDVEKRRKLELMFMESKMKALVATTAFGMGIDKPDISFVIHFQKPGNLVSYYQQIGRAGRALKEACAILLVGQEDDEINKYFIGSSFPTYREMDRVVKLIDSSEYLSLYQIMSKLDINKGRLEKCLKYLTINGDIYIENKKYYKSPRLWEPDMDYADAITTTRYNELSKMNEFVDTEECLMQFVAKELNDNNAKECNKCSNCLEKALFNVRPDVQTIMNATKYIKQQHYKIDPRKQWPSGVKHESGIEGNMKNRIFEDGRCEKGIVLSNYGDVGWGKIVRDNKYKTNYFEDQLVDVSKELLKDKVKEWDIKWVTSISSLRHLELVKNFAERLAKSLNLPYYNSIIKTYDATQQKELNNNHSQYRNAWDSFEVENVKEGNVLLVDDMVDSRWTFAVCGYKLLHQDSGKVYPFALSNTAGSGGSD